MILSCKVWSKDNVPAWHIKLANGKMFALNPYVRGDY